MVFHLHILNDCKCNCSHFSELIDAIVSKRCLVSLTHPVDDNNNDSQLEVLCNALKRLFLMWTDSNLLVAMKPLVLHTNTGIIHVRMHQHDSCGVLPTLSTASLEPIHVVMCCWKRFSLLRKILDNQNSQTVAHRIHLHVLNNNHDEKKSIEDIITKFKATTPHITITLKHFENKFYGFQRFSYIKDFLLPHHIADYVVMIDDDQQFSNDWVESLYRLRQPNTYKSWWGTAFTTHNYWQKRHTIDDKFDYGGTGGSIIDTAIFLPTTMLWNVPVDPFVYNIEDLWLSFVIRQRYNWDIVCSFLPPVMKNKAFRGTDVVAQHKVLRDKKQILLNYLIKTQHWKFIHSVPLKTSTENDTIYASSTNRYSIVKKDNEIQYVLQ